MADDANPRSIYLEALKALLRPIVRFGLRKSLSIHDFEQMLKRALVEVAREEIEAGGNKVNVSRISMLTGLYRNEIARIQKGIRPVPVNEPKSVLLRVISTWAYDRRFTNSSGEPRVLSCEGNKNEFEKLVKAVSGGISPALVLFELERNKAATKTARGVKLIRKTHNLTEDRARGYDVLSRDIEALVSAVDENLTSSHSIGNLHFHTEYDNIQPEALPEIRAWFIAQGRSLHKSAREFLSKFDDDLDSTIPSASEQKGAKIVLGSFSWTSSDEE